MKLRTVIATASTAAVLSTSGVALAGAAPNSGSTPSHTSSASAPAVEARAHPVRRHGARVRIRRLLRGAAGVVTKTIGIDRQQLRRDLRSGQTIAQIATAHGVDPQAVIDALVNAAHDRLAKAVADGYIAADRAARFEERLPARITRLVNDWHPRHLRTAPDA